MDLFQTPAQVGSVATMKDRTMKLTLYTDRELPGDEMALLMGLNQKQGWFMFSEAEIEAKDVPEAAPEFKDSKSPSQRLRNHLYVLWGKSGSKESFETYRAHKMEKIMDYIKEEIRREEEINPIQ